MPIVVDASVGLAWLFHEEHRPFADAVIEEGVAAGLAAPALFWLEVANVLALQLRRGRLSRDDRDGALADLLGLRISRHETTDRLFEIMNLAEQRGLTAYDAAYLELALRLGASLATLDRDLAAAAAAEGVGVRAP